MTEVDPPSIIKCAINGDFAGYKRLVEEFGENPNHSYLWEGWNEHDDMYEPIRRCHISVFDEAIRNRHYDIAAYAIEHTTGPIEFHFHKEYMTPELKDIISKNIDRFISNFAETLSTDEIICLLDRDFEKEKVRDIFREIRYRRSEKEKMAIFDHMHKTKHRYLSDFLEYSLYTRSYGVLGSIYKHDKKLLDEKFKEKQIEFSDDATTIE